ncbi:hypothetical protein [Chamaesiphon sp.]
MLTPIPSMLAGAELYPPQPRFGAGDYCLDLGRLGSVKYLRFLT